ncbi:unnamed protein product [Gordionus sp. m RMFG-2023]|uniref:vacuolar-sorting protein SNF8-like n=1 Tax=Gordionus sp. m RMFG-2023 TaxID=3053472 RepID=UPI0030E398E2
MRRKAGLASVERDKMARDRYKAKGSEMASARLALLTRSVETLKDRLQSFAAKHGNDIRSNPTLRTQFHAMCASLGVDPLSSARDPSLSMIGKIFLGRESGLLTRFYTELAVQVIEACLASRTRNGGILPLSQLTRDVTRSRGPYAPPINDADILETIRLVERHLGNGFRVVRLPKSETKISTTEILEGNPGKKSEEDDDEEEIYVQCAPGDLTVDHLRLIELARVKKEGDSKKESSKISKDTGSTGKAALTFDEMVKATGWEPERVRLGINYLIKDGLVWIDEQNLDHNGRSVSMYWFLNFF